MNKAIRTLLPTAGFIQRSNGEPTGGNRKHSPVWSSSRANMREEFENEVLLIYSNWWLPIESTALGMLISPK